MIYDIKSPDAKIKKICDNLAKTLIDKNSDYGNSFDKTMDEYGAVALIVRLEDKFNRLKNLSANNEVKVKDESLLDTIQDIAGYCVLALNYYETKKKPNIEPDN